MGLGGWTAVSGFVSEAWVGWESWERIDIGRGCGWVWRGSCGDRWMAVEDGLLFLREWAESVDAREGGCWRVAGGFDCDQAVGLEASAGTLTREGRVSALRRRREDDPEVARTRMTRESESESV